MPGRVATPDYVGNYLEFRYGTRASAFVDDRADVLPRRRPRSAYGVLLSGIGRVAGRPRAVTAFDVVLWPRTEPLAAPVGRGRRAGPCRSRDRRWVVAVRRGTTIRERPPTTVSTPGGGGPQR